MIELKTCKAEMTTCDYITIFDKEGNKLGTIQSNFPEEDWELIQKGHDPIEEHWEDGAGNVCTINGWGNK